MSILLPIFAMFLLTAVCTVRLGFLRFGAIRRGEVDPRYFRLYQDYEEPEKLRVHSRHLVNLFELPVLFYVITIIAFVTRQNGVLPVVLAWLYVLLRFAHTFVHLTSNNVSGPVSVVRPERSASFCALGRDLRRDFPALNCRTGR